MRRLGISATAGGLLFGVILAFPASAQPQPQTPAPTSGPGPTGAEQARPQALSSPGVAVSFGGEMRLIGYAWSNVQDFTDSANGRFRDNASRFFQRFRFFTTVEAADKKARAYWALEIGDLTWGAGGGASGAEFGTGSARTGNNTGGETGADGVNVETKNLYLQFDIPGLANANLLLGAARIDFLSSPTGAFLDDDAFGIQFNWRLDPIDLQLYTAKATENNPADADDNDLYAARLGVTLAQDTRLTVEGMIINEQCFARRLVRPMPPATTPTPTPTGTCVSADFGDTFWVGGTVATKLGTINLDGTLIYGQRQLFSDAGNRNIEESGWGAQLTARAPIGPVSTWWHAWYTTGDENRIVGLAPSGAQGVPGAGQDFAPISFTRRLNRDSGKLPVPIAGTSWVSAPFVAEAFFGHRSLGAPDLGQPLYANPTGTWGVGGSGILPLTPRYSLAGGVAFVAATEGNGIFGDSFVEIDAGALYSYNANLSFQGLVTYSIPDTGDDAWSVGFRTRFAF